MSDDVNNGINSGIALQYLNYIEPYVREIEGQKKEIASLKEQVELLEEQIRDLLFDDTAYVRGLKEQLKREQDCVNFYALGDVGNDLYLLPEDDIYYEQFRIGKLAIATQARREK